MATKGFSLNPCTKAEDAVSCEKGQRTTKRKARAAGRGHPSKGCSSEGDRAAEKMDAVAGFSEAHKISKQRQEHEENASDIINKKGCSSDGEAAFKKTEAAAGFSEVGKISKQKQGQEESADDFDAFIAKLEEEHEKYWGEYTSDGVKRFEYKDYSSYPVNDDGFVVLRG